MFIIRKLFKLVVLHEIVMLHLLLLNGVPLVPNTRPRFSILLNELK